MNKQTFLNDLVNFQTSWIHLD